MRQRSISPYLIALPCNQTNKQLTAMSILHTHYETEVHIPMSHNCYLVIKLINN